MIVIGSENVGFCDMFFVSNKDALVVEINESWWANINCSAGGIYGSKIIFEFNNVTIF